MVLAVVDAFAQGVDDAAGADFALEAAEELATRRVVAVERKRGCDLGLGRRKESRQLAEVNAVAAVVVGGGSLDPGEWVGVMVVGAWFREYGSEDRGDAVF